SNSDAETEFEGVEAQASAYVARSRDQGHFHCAVGPLLSTLDPPVDNAGETVHRTGSTTGARSEPWEHNGHSATDGRSRLKAAPRTGKEHGALPTRSPTGYVCAVQINRGVGLRTRHDGACQPAWRLFEDQ